MNKDTFHTIAYKGYSIHTCHNRDTKQPEVKCNVDGVDLIGKSLANMKTRVRKQIIKNSYKFTLVSSYYDKTDSGKSWKSKPYDVRTRRITMDEHDLLTNEDTRRFFKNTGGSERVERGYTKHGYLITHMISCNPSRDTKHVREFKEI